MSGSDGTAILRTERLSYMSNGQCLIDRISIEIHRGEILAIIGPSGAGKTMFLRLLNRLEEPTGGTVYLDERDYRSLRPRDLRRRVGMVMQTAALFPGTVTANIQFGPEQHGQPLTTDQIEGLLELMGLTGYAERDTSQLSGGEAQRVSLARTLANMPEVLLLDEPTTALDAIAARDIEELIRQIVHERHLACLMVTHDSLQATRLADRAMVLEQGQLQQIGLVEEVLNAQPMVC